ncbi:P-loop containing nucleoside triphosphate hydrolase protein [Suillus clintonianus]|uniref:P-loop containing nucleoside triphosphate hydrolase protein n=1 Tax=Suillus clintonianus TaxID=1904413 RepID=UPI001B876A3F|nr:P-loop containing nucleoside triphosphate hydrolase protein [Suillus clintonianus]KAG2152907.1 P-loop containing nucleoside triphosphate hydrolase protein [Suillus clintonianus]
MLSRLPHTWRVHSLRVLSRNLQTQARYEYPSRDEQDDTSFLPRSGLATPRQLVRYLDEYVIGQDIAKKVLSVAVFNHYTRVRANLAAFSDESGTDPWSEASADDAQSGVSSAHLHPHPQRALPHQLPLQPRQPVSLFEKSNVLVIGPTGSGKTLLARTLARVLDVPFSVSDATSFTQAGYVGEDVDMCIQRLLQAANWDSYRASTGIVYIDEVDKIARKSSSTTESSRDVGGEGVQQALLRMMEGSVVSVQGKPASLEPPVPTARGRGSPAAAQQRPDTYHIDTSNVLFILSGAFVGLDTVVKRRVSKGSIGFTANLAPKEEDSDSKGFMPFFTSNRRSSENLLEMIEPTDLVKYGFIPEFISRLPTITTLSPLSTQDLRRILTDVRGSLIGQYTALFGHSDVEIRFTTASIEQICLRAVERGGGARGLRGIMESLLLDSMYEVPGSNVRYVLITEDVVLGKSPALYWIRGDGPAFWAAWADEEQRAERQQV